MTSGFVDNDFPKYLDKLGFGMSLTPAALVAAHGFWSSLITPGKDQVNKLPQAGPTEDGGLQMVWDDGVSLLVVDVTENGALEWFSRNRETNITDGGPCQ